MTVKYHPLLFALLLVQLSLVFGAIASQDQQPAPDNTKVNQRDKDKSSPTADQQKVNPSDREITRSIRASIHKDKSLSTYAHNVKIISQGRKGDPEGSGALGSRKECNRRQSLGCSRRRQRG